MLIAEIRAAGAGTSEPSRESVMVCNAAYIERLGRLAAAVYLSVLLLGCLLGCGQDAKLGRVHGTIRLDGKPLTKGTAMFVPEAGRSAKGAIQSDGTFTLGTFHESDGALIGRHKVAVIAYEAGTFDRPAYETPNQKGKPLVPEKYMSPGTSGLTFEVKPGDNRPEFDLRSGR